MSRNNAFFPRILAASLVLALSSLSSSAFAYDPETREGELVQYIVLKWGAHVQETYGTPVQTWTNAVLPQLLAANVATLEQAAKARTFDGMTNALLGGSAPQFGSILYDKDLTLVPIKPCRLFDTRNGGSPIQAGETRGFDVTDTLNYVSQGGATTNCGIGDAGPAAAAVINFTVVNHTTGGFITAYPAGTERPLAATVNYNPGLAANNLAVLRLDQGDAKNEIEVFSHAKVDLVGDVVAYYTETEPKPVATLKCVETGTAQSLPTASGFTVEALAPACPAGYSRVSTTCFGPYDAPIFASGTGVCRAKNNAPMSTQITATSVCCRVSMP